MPELSLPTIAATFIAVSILLGHVYLEYGHPTLRRARRDESEWKRICAELDREQVVSIDIVVRADYGVMRRTFRAAPANEVGITHEEVALLARNFARFPASVAVTFAREPRIE